MTSMRALLCSAVLWGTVAVQAQAPPPKTHLKVGDIAPDFTLPATTGGNISLSEFRGKKTVVLAFFPAAFSGG